ncbi:NADH-ubiquinone oxidoreductase-F iron-sulfur binding region domain-containing protein [Methylocella sp. CPCC 101449]|uniref:formate dehydrogenase beta subunit n=1 Tax=Methylocella sp. CPCC 101449 TaxID=2987531 RepID=UPI002892306F|nr:NADH-ubiquinone oxidoreductase-F iron-sulfur binding region domain-containing protein [Methylocella sp. CPCC 101449]MDT2023650.1 SLBB domain-containing protein [Methylocella sp. CPCC 101449]
MSAVRIFVPRDAAALSVGADDVATALAREIKARGLDATIVRNGSRGMLWLEPLVEIETARGRIGYGLVQAGDVASLFDAGLLDGKSHALCIGRVEDHDYFKRQQRLTFARVGVIDPLSLDDYRAHGGLIGLEKARALAPAAIVEEIVASGLRGRGGAGFPAGIKWRTVLEAQGPQKFIVCNADEGDSGTFADRMLMEGDPFLLVEGMAIAGLATGATRGVIYIRSEYPHAIATMREAIAIARRADLLNARFDIEIRVGAGAYVCGEETSLLESIEGKRGQVRAKPPLPAHKGLFSCPTVINNVLTLAAAPTILAEGGKAYAEQGMGRSRGTLPFQIAGNVKRGGLFEAPFGLTLRTLIEDIGGGTASGRPLRAVQVGGPLGAYFPESLLDTPLDYEAMAAKAGLLGHGGIVVFDDTVDMAHQARFAFDFCAIESCGKCTPCRIGSTRGVETIDKITQGQNVEANIALVKDLCTVLTDGSLCALGGLTPMPVMSALTHFPDDFRRSALHAAAE